MVTRGRKNQLLGVMSAKFGWKRYFNLIGDKIPDKNQIHLPSWDKQKDIYLRYTNDMHAKGISEDQLVVLSTFYRMWKDDFPNVHIPAVSNLASP